MGKMGFVTTYPSLSFLALSTVVILSTIFIIDEVSKTSSEWYWDNNPNEGRCEETDGNEANFLREPANAVSNVVFMLVGLYAFLCSIYDFRHFRSRSFPLVPPGIEGAESEPKGGISDSPILSIAFAFSMVFGGYGSFYYHACSGCSRGGQLDIWSVFVLCNAVAFLLIVFTYLGLAVRLAGGGVTGRLACKIFCLVAWAWTSWITQYWRDPPIWQGSWQKMYRLMLMFLGLTAGVALVLVFILIRLKVRSTYHVFVPGAVACVVLGVGAWFPEEINEDCIDVFGGEFGEGRESFFQLHALWHSMLALCMLSMYMYVRGLAVTSLTLDRAMGKGALTLLDFHLMRETRVEGEGVGMGWEERGGAMPRIGGGFELGEVNLEERILFGTGEGESI